MSEPQFNEDGSRYRPYWWYFVWVVTIVSALSILAGGIYALAVMAPRALEYIGYGVLVMGVLAMFAFVAWLSQGGRG